MLDDVDGRELRREGGSGATKSSPSSASGMGADAGFLDSSGRAGLTSLDVEARGRIVGRTTADDFISPRENVLRTLFDIG